MAFDYSVCIPRPPAPRKTKQYKVSLAEHLNATLQALPDIDPEELVEYANFFGEQCRWAFLRQMGKEKSEWRLRPSDQKCPRQSWYKRNGYPAAEDTAKHATFLFGDVAEAFVVTLLYIAGVEVMEYQMPLTIPAHGGNVKGTLDLLVRWNKKLWILDVKTTSSWGFKNAEAGMPEDSFGYRPQVKIYATSEELKGKVDGEMLLFFNKETGREFCQVLVATPDDKDVEAWFRHGRAVLGDEEPALPVWATRDLRPRLKVYELTDVRCRYCPFVQSCHGEDWVEVEPHKWQKKA